MGIKKYIKNLIFQNYIDLQLIWYFNIFYYSDIFLLNFLLHILLLININKVYYLTIGLYYIMYIKLY